MKKEVRKCAVCGKKFTPKSANAAYCSDKCYKIAKAKKDKARKAKAKAAKKAVKKVAKPTTRKPVKLTEKIALPKNQSKESVRVVKQTVHTVKPNDVIRFDKAFTPERILAYATRLAGLAVAQIVKSVKKGK